MEVSVFEPEETLDDLFELAAGNTADEPIEEDSPLDLDLEENEEEEEEENQPAKTPKAKKPKVDQDNVKDIVDYLVDEIDEFLVYEDHENRSGYTKAELSELIGGSINHKAELVVQTTLSQILDNVSPTAQKLLKGELNGVKIKDIIKDIEDYIDIDEIPENPSDVEKEKIVRKYYNKIAKDRGKDAAWVSSRMTKIVEMDDLDSEFDDAKEFLEGEIESKIEAKRKEEEAKKDEDKRFKQYHQYFVNEALKEDNIFGIKLSKGEKEEVANILSSFIVHPVEKKEKMGLKLLIDNLIYSKNPKESYKTLALMTLVAARPSEIIKKLQTTAETTVTKDVVTKLKTATRSSGIRTAKKEPIIRSASIFD